MKAGFSGTFVISWAQTELDGQKLAPLTALRIGMEWRWTGQAVRVDGPADILLLSTAMGEAELHSRAALSLCKRMVDGSVAPMSDLANPSGAAPFAADFTVSDGRQTWDLDLIQTGPDRPVLVMCRGAMPSPDQDLWVVHHALGHHAGGATRDIAPARGVICFTPGTLIQTETGPRAVEHLTQNDRIQTKDNGCQAVLWIGNRRLTGARLYAMPHLRPVRIAAGALDQNVPEPGLTVSPDHRIVLRGPRARALFNADEVLVKVRDLINDRTILIDYASREVTYFHLLLPAHQIVFANGLETESLHPAGAGLDTGQWAALDALIPDISADPFVYGPHARRTLSQSEAAIFRYDQH
jgi:Hint domain